MWKSSAIAGLSAVSTLAVGRQVDRFSYLSAIVAAGTIGLLATVSVLILIRPPANKPA